MNETNYEVTDRDAGRTKPPTTLLSGDAGSGKTESLKTYIKAGVTPFVVVTEQSSISTLMKGINKGDAHYIHIPPTTEGWAAMKQQAQKMTMMQWESMIEYVDPNKRKFDSWVRIIDACTNFKCDWTGEEFGDITDWGPDRAFCVDSLTGLNKSAMQLIIGGRLIRSQPQWGAAQETEMSLIYEWVENLNCFFAMTTHLERREDTLHGGITLNPKALGKAIGPDIPPLFSDAICCKREGGRWFWSTDEHNMKLKAQNVPWSSEIEPDFKIIVDAYRARA